LSDPRTGPKAAVLDVDLAADPADATGLETYAEALVIVRFRGIPVGQFWTPITNGRIDRGVLASRARSASMPAFSWRWLQHRFAWNDGAPQPLPSATIAICTRERPDDLVRTLVAVEACARGEHPILVVDNRPETNATARVVAAHPQVRYVREDRPGLNAARNRALREATTDIVAFTDDDATPERGWVEALRRAFRQPLVIGATGLTIPLELETPAQQWFERTNGFGRGFFRHEFDPLDCTPHSAGQVGAGANMALRRDVLTRVGPFDERLDAGTPAKSGGDHEMFTRILSRGYWLVYEPSAVSRHRHRRSWPELRDTLRGYGTGVYAMWTGRLVEYGDMSVVKQAAWWFLKVQGPGLFRALLGRPGAPPLDLIAAELRGCAAGPAAWFRSRRLANEAGA
jgi:GT2 family glycosyltransferase